MTADTRPRPLRVLNVHSGNLYGGIEAFHTTMARVAKASGIDEEFALCFEGRPAAELRAAGIVVHSLGEVRMRRPLQIARARRALGALLARGGYDIVVTHSAWSHALFAGTVRRHGRPLAFHLHDSVTQVTWLDRLARRSRPDVLLSNSAYTASTAVNLFPEMPCVVVSYPVATSVPAPGTRAAIRGTLGATDDTCVILQASRMQAWKGQELHIEALARVRTRSPWVCWMAGGAQRPEEEDYAARLRRMVADAGLEERIKWLGQRSDVPALMAAADVFCQPNKGAEPFGIVFIEALSAGLPVVATAMGGAAEIVVPSCGVLAPPGDVDALAQALTGLIDDPARRRATAEPARLRAREMCEPETQTRKLRKVLARAAGVS